MHYVMAFTKHTQLITVIKCTNNRRMVHDNSLRDLLASRWCGN